MSFITALNPVRVLTQPQTVRPSVPFFASTQMKTLQNETVQNDDWGSQASSQAISASRLPLALMTRRPESVRFGSQMAPVLNPDYTQPAPVLGDLTAVVAGDNNATAAWRDRQRLLPDYRLSGETRAVALRAAKGLPQLDGAVVQVAESLLPVRNARAFMMGAPLKTLADVTPEATQWINDVTTQTPLLTTTLRQLGVNEAGQQLVNQWVGAVAPQLLSLGFADAIGHSIQVARMAALSASQQSQNPTDIVAAALVGIIHDPKLDKSFENLATHPLVASAISQDLLANPVIQQSVKTFLADANATQTPDAFGQSIVLASAINNDSKWVNDNVVNAFVKKGLSEARVSEFSRVAQQRFESLGKGSRPEAFSPELVAELNGVPFKTGFTSISRPVFDNAVETLVNSGGLPLGAKPEAVYQQILKGELAAFPDITRRLKDEVTKQQGLKDVTVPSRWIFFNTEELKGQPALVPARSLAQADNMLLSLHKIILAGNEPTVLDRVKSFMKSFDDNVQALPEGLRPQSRVSQRDMAVSVLTGIETLTGQTWRDKLPADYVTATPERQANALRLIIETPSQWVSRQTGLDYGVVDLTPLGFTSTAPEPVKAATRGVINDIAGALKPSYDAMLETSNGFFKVR